jgi:hypothetical protein
MSKQATKVDQKSGFTQPLSKDKRSLKFDQPGFNFSR